MTRPQKRLLLVSVLLASVCISGCDAVSRHAVLSTILDGVPSLPPPEPFCREYIAKIEAEEAAKQKIDPQQARAKRLVAQGLSHKPYAEKKCESCHDKEKEGGLIKPLKELCAVCHPNYPSGEFQHGPAAVRDCLACHLPHSASAKPLLKREINEVCATCHHEERLSAKMHANFSGKKMKCTDCHDPHGGEIRYFLR